MTAAPLPGDTIINVNVPDLPLPEIKGFRATRLGYRHMSEAVIRSIDPYGAEIFWVGPAGMEQDAGTGTDFCAVREGFVSVTPLQVDITQHSKVAEIGQWLEQHDA